MDDEFKPYAPEKDVILKRFKDEHGPLELRAADLRQEAQMLTNDSNRVIRDGSRLKHRLLSVHLPWISLTTFVLASAITGSVGKVVANWASFALTPFQRIIVSVVAAVALAAQTVRLTLSYSHTEGQANSAVSDEVLAWDLFDRSLRAAVDEALRRSINDIFDVRGMLAVATAAPRLVELDASDIRPSHSLDYVRNFIKSHDSSRYWTRRCSRSRKIDYHARTYWGQGSRPGLVTCICTGRVRRDRLCSVLVNKGCQNNSRETTTGTATRAQ